MGSVLDTSALDKAVKSVDAVICAYNNMPELVVGGHLALLYAVGWADVKAGCDNYPRLSILRDVVA